MTTGEHTMVEVSAVTDVGLRRQHNEDSHGVWQPGDPGTLESRGVLMVVADGMGGSQAGEVASRSAVASERSCTRGTAATMTAAAADTPIARCANRVQRVARLMFARDEGHAARGLRACAAARRPCTAFRRGST